MNIVFSSNYFNHHQRYLSDALFRLTNGQYRFIANSEMREDRKKLGYGESEIPSYVLDAHDDETAARQAEVYASEADVLITGVCPDTHLRPRYRQNKLIFHYSERPLKKGKNPLKYLIRRFRLRRRFRQDKPVYLLCASAYASADYDTFGMYRNRAYRWGYFPEVRTYEDVPSLLAGKDRTEILWCGRLIDWKHPDDVLTAAETLRAEGHRFHITMIGSGDMEDTLKRLIREKHLETVVTMTGSMKPHEVRTYMEKAGIYLFTSDFNEGWGAVLNESMNSGCAVIASHAIGSVPYLIQDGENGLIYRSGDVDGLTGRIRDLLCQPEKQRCLGEAAYRTMTDVWNADEAARRLLILTEHIQKGETSPDLFRNGPCSQAPLLRDDWYTSGGQGRTT